MWTKPQLRQAQKTAIRQQFGTDKLVCEVNKLTFREGAPRPGPLPAAFRWAGPSVVNEDTWLLDRLPPWNAISEEWIVPEMDLLNTSRGHVPSMTGFSNSLPSCVVLPAWGCVDVP